MSIHKVEVAPFLQKNMHKKMLSICLLSAAVAGISGCQTTSGFNGNLSKAKQAYPLTAAIKPLPSQLANHSAEAPSTSDIAHKRVLRAVDQFLTTPHSSVSQYKTFVRPFVEKGSLDEGSQSVTQTIMEVLAYQEDNKVNGYADDEYNEYEYDAIDAIYEEQLKNNKSLSDDEAWEIAEAVYNARQQKLYDDNLEPDLKQTLLNKLTELNESYQQMKAEQEEAEEESTSTSIFDMMRPSSVSSMILGTMYSSPEQVEALQTYTMQYLSTNSVGQYEPAQREYKSVLSYDFSSPTRELSIQVPYKVDFNKASITLDPSAALPIMAMVSPENTPLPEEKTTHTIEFSLPEEIKAEIPTDVLFDAFLKGVNLAFSEMNTEDFTPLDITDDTFAKSINAKRAVKVNWGSKQTGTFVGKVMKSMGNTVEQYINDNPQKYDDDSKLIEILNKWLLVKNDFQSKDVGGLIQAIEAIAPISFDQTQYYYLNASDQLIAMQAKSSIGSEFYGMTMDNLTETRYNQKLAAQSPLYPLLTENFSANAPAAIDGNEWINQMQLEEHYNDEAKYARWGYNKSEYSLTEEALAAEALVEEATESMDIEEAVESAVDSTVEAEAAVEDASLEETNKENYKNTADAFKQFEQNEVLPTPTN
ncbi:hypothetical protein VH441_02945 [Psychrobacter sp. HD31]|uniref:hypothetical protein n=1 Tax=Psychrobacter sp. HD31 TaxID=3112003 RepID=UPI003DA225C6